jgi:chitinase
MYNSVYKLIAWVMCSFLMLSNAQSKPYCTDRKLNSKKIIAYLGADSSWSLKDGDLDKLNAQLDKVSLVNYSFIRLQKDNIGNTILKLSNQDSENIALLHQLKPELPIMIAIGGWGERQAFSAFLGDKEKTQIFVDSVKKVLEQNRLDGIDVDWENELLASQSEINGVTALLSQLHDIVGKKGYCITNAVPGTKAYWQNYPNAGDWADFVDWTTIMAYDNYGTFGPKTEHGAALYEKDRIDNGNYPYPTAAGDMAVKHYFRQGLVANKIILGIPFYCHSYFVDNKYIDTSAKTPGLHTQVLDPNINSQISYESAYNSFGDTLFSYKHVINENYTASYGLISIANTNVSQFLSCDNRESINDKINYVLGNNSISQITGENTTLGGVSFWSLQQDLPYSHHRSLLGAIVDGFDGSN